MDLLPNTARNRMSHERRTGFTLIELLVVIAIVALLISILLPALGRARKAARQAISLSNIRQISMASVGAYTVDNKGSLPLVLPHGPRYDPRNVTAAGGYCSWTSFGKNNDKYWYNTDGGYADIEAADRPANPYIVPGTEIYAPERPTRLPANDAARTALQLPVFKDPSDIQSHQRMWPDSNADDRRNPNYSSSYDDVGTSYHTNLKFLDDPENPDANPNGADQVARAWKWGINRLRIADAFNPARFVWTFDQYTDIVSYYPKNFKYARFINTYGDLNKSVMGFMDGHAAYLPYYSTDELDENGKPINLSNRYYTFVFEPGYKRNPN